jgi:hypothetical protein
VPATAARSARSPRRRPAWPPPSRPGCTGAGAARSTSTCAG